MNMKTTSVARTSAALAALTAGAFILSACGPNTSAPADSAAPAESDAVSYAGIEPAKEIDYWSNHPGASIDLEKAMLDAFTAETGIKVNHVTAGANYEEVSQKFQTAQVSGDAGDLVVLSDVTWFPQFLNGAIAPIDPILEELGEDTSTYVPALYNDYLYEGQHYAVPFARSTPLFYYNKDLYEAAGITEAPKTWDDVAANAKKLTQGEVVGFAYPEESEYPAWTMANLAWGYGGAWSDEWDLSPLTGPETVEALTFAQNLVKEGSAAVVSGDPATSFSAGAAAQVIASTGSMKGILEAATFEVGAAFLPAGPAADTGIVPTGGAGIAVSASSTPEEQLAAAMLASFMTNAENTATFSAGTGYMPVRTDADMSAKYAETPLFETAVKQLEHTRSQDFARLFIPGGDRALAQNLQKILTGADIQSTLEAAAAEIQTNFDRDLAAKVK